MSIEKELKTTTGDIAHKIVKTAISSVPVAEGALSELFVTLVAEPSSKRRDTILIKIDERLNELASKINEFNIERLSENEVFLSTVSQAYQIAMRTHQNEKIKALLNAISNSATGSLDDNLQHMFLMFIDSFTEWHLRLVILLDNPIKVLKEKGLQTDFYMGSLSTVITTAYSQLAGRKEFCRQLMRDLYNRSLINTPDDSLNTTMTGNGMVASRTTELGKQFIQFISEYTR